VCERELDFTGSVQNLYCLMKGKRLMLFFIILLKLCGSVEALSKLLIIAPKLWGTCGSEQQDCTATGSGDHTWCCTMDTVTLTEPGFVFQEGHGINFVEIHNVVKFLANGLCKSDIYESVRHHFYACSNLRTTEWILKASGNSGFYENFVSHFSFCVCLRI